MSETMTEAEEKAALTEARALVRDLFKPRASIYWPDFLFHTALGWAALVACIMLPSWSWQQLVAYGVALFALYRAVIFIHELSHLRPGALPGFRLWWNLLCGCPLLVPSFTYSGVHNHHHKLAAYGREEDGEYLPFARLNPMASIGFLLSGLLTPVAVVLRFMLLTPLCWLIPPLRPVVWRHVSSLSIDFRYRREVSSRDDRHWRWQEVACFVWSVAIAAGLLTGLIPWRALLMWALVMIGVFLVNGVRTLVAHRYRYPGHEALSMMQQFQDSVDVPGQLFITGLWAPVGLRYHATHHLFPSMPYHNLGQAHRRLLSGLDDNRWYTVARENHLFAALSSLWRDARRRGSPLEDSVRSPRQA